MSLIEFRGVTFVHQNGVKALDDVSLSVGRQELVGIVGENGAGKTTLVKHINGLLKPTKGSVTIEGNSTRDVTRRTSRNVGIAFQNPDHQLFSDSVENEITFALKNFGFESALIEERIEVGSGVLRARAVSQVLAAHTERRGEEAADAGLHPRLGPGRGRARRAHGRPGQRSRRRSWPRWWRTLHSTGKTIIIVSHDVEFLWTLQPRLLVMKQGKISETGPPRP